MRFLLILPLGLALAACGTPQERCVYRETRDLRTVDSLIATSQLNLSRGYAMEDKVIYEPVWETCGDRFRRNKKTGEVVAVAPRLCLETRPRTISRPKAIDLAAEARLLASLQAKRTELAREAQASVSQCKAQYPE
ncbi:hypothetical protein FAZ78_13740 [Cereibacter changlensis]|uniref:Lipoprotein n=1 Tax=Cereibacter changlensis TaxID=402884 RepID=A0A4U0YZ37_9RHOB|nr:hypothetical protein [Cereibacter changlensis]TKA96016.1 hypothetical protein FAZ78_13740 [Cereibacter changlensis]